MNSPRRAHAHARPPRRTQAKAGAHGGNVRFRAFDSRPIGGFVFRVLGKNKGINNHMTRISVSAPKTSANTNCHPIKTQSTAPSSITKLVEANISVRAGMSAAPCCIALRAAATAAYEQELLAAPKPVANETDFKFVWPNARLICSLPTKTWRTPEMVKPSTSAQNVAQSIASA